LDINDKEKDAACEIAVILNVAQRNEESQGYHSEATPKNLAVAVNNTEKSRRVEMFRFAQHDE